MITSFDKFAVAIVSSVLYAIGTWGGIDVENVAGPILQFVGAIGGPIGVWLVPNK